MKTVNCIPSLFLQSLFPHKKAVQTKLWPYLAKWLDELLSQWPHLVTLVMTLPGALRYSWQEPNITLQSWSVHTKIPATYQDSILQNCTYARKSIKKDEPQSAETSEGRLCHVFKKCLPHAKPSWDPMTLGYWQVSKIIPILKSNFRHHSP